MKSYNSPPILIKLALEAACVMLGIQPKITEVGEGKNMRKEYDYWGKAKKLLNEHKKFLESLVKYDKDNIPDVRLGKIKEYLDRYFNLLVVLIILLISISIWLCKQ